MTLHLYKLIPKNSHLGLFSLRLIKAGHLAAYCLKLLHAFSFHSFDGLVALLECQLKLRNNFILGLKFVASIFIQLCEP